MLERGEEEKYLKEKIKIVCLSKLASVPNRWQGLVLYMEINIRHCIRVVNSGCGIEVVSKREQYIQL